MSQFKLWNLLMTQKIDEPTYRELSERLARREQKNTYSDSMSKPNTKANLAYSNKRAKIRF